MNKLTTFKIAGSFLIAALAPAVLADTVVLSQGPYSFSDGGEFTATTTPTITSLSLYSPYTSTATSFQTFCVQDSTDFQPGNTYSYTVSSISLGGPGYPGGSATVGNPNSYPLSEGTAFLYSEFARGLLPGYDFSNGLGLRQTDAGLLQAAIWLLQGGQVDGSYPNGGVGNPYYDFASGVLGGALTANATAATDFGVQIMNLSSIPADPNKNYQNQLILVPDSSSTLILLGAALSSLAVYRRRF